jgi:hypothetical protein
LLRFPRRISSSAGRGRGRSRRLVLVEGPLEGRIAIVAGLTQGIFARLASDGATIAAVDVSREKAERVADQVSCA